MLQRHHMTTRKFQLDRRAYSFLVGQTSALTKAHQDLITRMQSQGESSNLDQTVLAAYISLKGICV